MEIAKKTFIVTGGGGFLGKALCLRLKDQGAQVISISRSSYPELVSAGIKVIQHDISDPFEPIYKELSGVDGVFHTASKVDMWGRYEEFYKTNVVGTANVVNACLNLGIRNLVYTSSPSVIADGTDTKGIDESYPYPEKYIAFYPQTKAMAEQLVKSANNESFYTVTLRPHLIWGPGDRHLIPTVLKRARAGRLIQVGDGQNLVDTSFIDDCVDAHILAMMALTENPAVRGRAYFISQGEPVKLWQWINTILTLHNLPLVKKKISKRFASILAGTLEFCSKLLPSKPEPLFTRFLASQMSSDHYFNIDNAKKDLGYAPKFSIDEALRVTFSNS